MKCSSTSTQMVFQKID